MTDSAGHEYEIIDGLDLDLEEDLSPEDLQRRLTEATQKNITLHLTLSDLQDQLKLKDSQISTLLIEVEKLRSSPLVISEDLRPKLDHLQQENDSLISALAGRDQELFEIKKFLEAKEDLRLELEFCSKDRRDSDSNRKMSLEDQKLHELKWFYEEKIRRLTEVHEEELAHLKLKSSPNDPLSLTSKIPGNPPRTKDEYRSNSSNHSGSDSPRSRLDDEDNFRLPCDQERPRISVSRDTPMSLDSLSRQLEELMGENEGLKRDLESLKAENTSLMYYVKNFVTTDEENDGGRRRTYNHNQKTGTKIMNLFKEFFQ